MIDSSEIERAAASELATAESNEILSVFRKSLVGGSGGDDEEMFLVKALGISFSYDDATCTAEMQVHPWMGNLHGSLHGGVIALGLDTCMGHLLKMRVGPSATVETSIRYLRPVTEGRVKFVAEFLKRGKRLQVLQSKMLAESGEIAAFATASWVRV
ncbi:PaaI family thioesterase [Devosia naphthalenivorans]|uniref:PaaI family thioesterase n=1 Tax=Devosia naphthalenivorans TaxID=2082392 RepID=UPI000D3C8462|nr:PaaI family thioesterase [Devosia naphthalenivorans]